jgi:hypothetical protein
MTIKIELGETRKYPLALIGGRTLLNLEKIWWHCMDSWHIVQAPKDYWVGYNSFL